ncbi:MAG: M48 family metalloprotease [Acidobacteriota bacterium]
MSPLVAARAALPAWVPFVAFLALPLGFAFGWGTARLLTPLAYRRVLAARDAHWTERARLAWPARKWTGLALFAVPAVLGALLAHLGGPMSLLGRGAAGLLAGSAALAGFALGTWPAARRMLGPDVGSRRRYLESSVSLLLVRAPHLAVAAAVAALMPPRLSGHAIEAAALLSVGTVLVFVAAFGGGLRTGRFVGLLRDGNARLREAVAAVAARAGVAVPASVIMACHVPVAFAIPLRRILVFSDSALALLDDAELESVVAHETGHLTENRSVTLQRVSGLFFFTLVMAGPSLAGEGGRTAFFAVLFTLLALVAVGAFSRRTAVAMERRADDHAAAHAEAPGVYARALEKLHEAALAPAVLGKRNATHPDLWDRMAADGSPPSWPKPAPPAGGGAGRFALGAACAIVFVAAEAELPGAVAVLARRSPLAALAVTGGEAWPLSELARARAAGRRPAEAVAFYRAAFALDGRPEHLANAAFVESHAGRCSEAKALADEAARALARVRAGPDSWEAHLVTRARIVADHCGRGIPETREED